LIFQWINNKKVFVYIFNFQNLGSKTGEFGDQSTAAAHAHAIAYAQVCVIYHVKLITNT